MSDKVKKFIPFGEKLPNGQICSEETAKEFLKAEFTKSSYLIDEFIYTEKELGGKAKAGAWIEVGKETPRFFLSKSADGTSLILKDEAGKIIGNVVINGNEETALDIEKNDFIRASGTLSIGDKKYQFNGSELSIKGYGSEGKDLHAFIINGTNSNATAKTS